MNIKNLAKHTLTLVSTCALLLACSACSGTENGSSQASVPSSTAPESSETSAVSSESAVTPTPTETSESSTPVSSATPASTPETNQPHVLVVYFSATGTTKGVAETLKTVWGEESDLFEIVPQEPYTDTDLDYNTDCRANDEQNDNSARPAIANTVENMEQYDTVFIGYPIWWGIEPKIICTFMESYDFSGKTVVPFCTSGGNGPSSGQIEALASSATVLSGRRFAGGVSESEMADWVNSLGLK